MSDRTRRAQIAVSADILEKNILAGVQITDVKFDATRRIITFYVQDDRFDPVPEAMESYRYGLTVTDDKEWFTRE